MSFFFFFHFKFSNYPHLASGILLSPPSVCLSVRPSVRYAISSQTAGQNPTKFGEWLAYTSGACKSTFIFGPAPRGPGEGSKGQILTSVGICDGMPSTARSGVFLFFSVCIVCILGSDMKNLFGVMTFLVYFT